MSRAFLSSATALAFWLSAKAAAFDKGFVNSLVSSGDNLDNYMAYLKGPMDYPTPIPLEKDAVRLTQDEAQALRRYLGTWPPVHTMAAPGSKPQTTMRQIEHLHPVSAPDAAYLMLSSRLAVPMPELTLLQCMTELNDCEALVLCSLFCSIFCFDSTIVQQQRPRRMISSRERIAGFLGSCSALGERLPPGTKRLERVLPYAVERAASPAELELALRMSLPQSKGGYGFGALLLNQRIATKAGSGNRYCDFYLPKAHLGIEYHSDAEHGYGVQWKDDAMRSNELLGARIAEFVLTSRELMSVKCMDRAALEIARRVHAREFSMDSKAVEERERLRMQLRAALRTFSRFG